MLVIEEVLDLGDTRVGAAPARTPPRTVTLPFDKRRVSRQRLTLDDGTEAALFLPRGTVLAPGAELVAKDGTRVRVVAAAETVSRVKTQKPLLLARAAYHLGNRHVPVQIAEGFLAYLHDHVLDDMIRQLGLSVEVVDAAFEPESGAYGRHGHAHHHGHHAHGAHDAHDQDHAHGHAHDHSHAHDPDDHDPAQAHDPAHGSGVPR